MPTGCSLPAMPPTMTWPERHRPDNPMLDILAITGPIYLCIALGYLATRGGLFERSVSWVDVGVSVAMSILLVVLGFWTFSRLERSVLKEI